MIQKILNKINEGQESDTEPYTIENTPESLIEFWEELFKNEVI